MKLMDGIREIVLHHTATRDGETLSWEAIRQRHMRPPPEGKGFKEIGYHFGLEMYYGACQVLVGRPLHFQGAGVEGKNAHRVHVALTGNFDETIPGPQMIDRLLWLLLDIVDMNGLPVDRETIKGHRDLAHTRCPGENLNVDDVVRRLAEMVPN